MIAIDTNVLISLLDFKKDFLEILYYEGYTKFIIFDFIIKELEKVLGSKKAKTLLKYYFNKYNFEIKNCDIDEKDIDTKLILCCKKYSIPLVTFDKKLIYKSKKYNIRVITFNQNKII